MLFVITIKRANSNGRCYYYQRERVKRKFDPFRMSAAGIARQLGVATSSITRAIEKMVEGTG